MNIVFLKNEIGRRLFFLAIFCGLLLALYFTLVSFIDLNEGLSIAIVEGLGALEIETVFQILPVLAFSLPFVLFIMNTGDLMYSEYATKGSFILTRLQDKKIWNQRMLLNVFKLSFMYLLVLFSTFIFTCIVIGYSIEIANIKEVMLLFLFMLLTYIAFSLLSNVVCFLTRSGLGYVTVITLYFVSLFSSAFIYDAFPTSEKWIIWLPTSQQIISWHDIPLTLGANLFYIESFTLEFSFFYLLIINVIIGVWLYMVIQRYESY